MIDLVNLNLVFELINNVLIFDKDNIIVFKGSDINKIFTENDIPLDALQIKGFTKDNSSELLVDAISRVRKTGCFRPKHICEYQSLLNQRRFWDNSQSLR